MLVTNLYRGKLIAIKILFFFFFFDFMRLILIYFAGWLQWRMWNDRVWREKNAKEGIYLLVGLSGNIEGFYMHQHIYWTAQLAGVYVEFLFK